MRHLDLTALRSFVAVADTGGVTRAANLLNLTQSAVSMQMKRLEEALNVTLLDRSARQVGLTAAGEQLLSYARRILAMNDEAVSRLTDPVYEGDLTLGVPHDIVYPHIPAVLQRFNCAFPRMNVHLVSSYTLRLKELFERGECAVILTTEDRCGPDGQTVCTLPMVWVGAPGGLAWRTEPLKLAFETNCMFRNTVQAALDKVGRRWEMAVNSESIRTIEATVSADLAVTALLDGTAPPYLDPVEHGGHLPALPSKKINLYVSEIDGDLPRARLAEMIAQAYAGGSLRGRSAA